MRDFYRIYWGGLLLVLFSFLPLNVNAEAIVDRETSVEMVVVAITVRNLCLQTYPSLSKKMNHAFSVFEEKNKRHFIIAHSDPQFDELLQAIHEYFAGNVPAEDGCQKLIEIFLSGKNDTFRIVAKG